MLENYVPSTESAYNALLRFVKEHQGEKGYFRTDDTSADTIWGFIYDEGEQRGVEVQVLAVRVSEDEIQVYLGDSALTYKVEYTEEDFKNEENWYDLKFSDVYYPETLFRICEVIEQYIENN